MDWTLLAQEAVGKSEINLVTTLAELVGTGITVSILLTITWTLWKAFQEKDKEVSTVAKESVEALTKIWETNERDKEARLEVRRQIESILEHIQGDEVWRTEIVRRLENIQSIAEKLR